MMKERLDANGKLLRRQMKDEVNNNNLFYINNLLNTQTFNDCYNINQSLNDANFNNMLKSFRESASYLEKDEISDYVNNITDETVLNSDEYEFNTHPINSFIDGITDLFSKCNKMSKESKLKFKDITNRSQLICNLEDSLFMESRETQDYIIQTLEVNDDSKEDGDNAILPNEDTVVTRSKSRKIKLQESLQSVKRVQYINNHYNEMMTHMDTRNEIMYDLFGHRGLLNIFDMNQIKRKQKNDNLLQLIRYILLKINKQQTIETKYLESLKAQSYYYYFKVNNGQMRINNDDILETREYTLDANPKNLEEDQKWVICIPTILRGKYMDYAHHNHQSQHLTWTYSYDFLRTHYYWPGMKRDMQVFAEKCKVCGFCKGSIRHRAPMQIRYRPKPREHIMCDFIGPIFSSYGTYHILAIIDYATGWTMLVPTNGNDAITIIDVLLHKWIPLFGVMATIETDYGSGFDSHLYRMLMHSLGVKYEYAERNNHRSIGKVERVIGFVQSILKRYNVQLHNSITSPKASDYEAAWDTIELLLPHIQSCINQRRPRFTTYSPNMLMFGSQLNDVSDIGKILSRMSKAKQYSNISDDSYTELESLINKLTLIYRNFNEDYKKYVFLSKERYDKTHRERNSKKRKRYQVGKEVLYYCGDRQKAGGKWLSQWTGPWTITKKLSDATRIITDKSNGNQIRVSIDRLKLFYNRRAYLTYEKLGLNEDFKLYEDKLSEILYKYDVKSQKKTKNLDYRTNVAGDVENLK